MSRVTKFAARDPGVAARMAGFVAHLRDNGQVMGVGATETALSALACVDCVQPDVARSALKAVCSGSHDAAARFDALFEAYWMNGGRVREKATPADLSGQKDHTRSSEFSDGIEALGRGAPESPDESGSEQGETHTDGTGKLVASQVSNLMKKDLRELVSARDIREAEAVAERLGRALRDRRSRRRRMATKGDQLDFRRTVRRSLATGGEPLRLARRNRPDRPIKIVALADVSGSMTVYARPFLAFLAGLMRADSASDAYLFHTRLVRITEALRDDDPLRALNRLTLLADGFGGGSKIGASLDQFNGSYARRFVNGRTVVLILSDGYDTDPATRTSAALERLKRRGCKVIWLNPLKSWRDYEPISAAMAAAMPHLDLFRPAATLNDLAALEAELGGL